MKTLLIALLVAFPLAANAASPEDGYIAARDKYVAKFKSAGDMSDAVAKQEADARADLETKLRALLGRVSAEGVPPEGKSNLDTLTSGELGFGQLDALVHQTGEDGPRLLVTTPALAKRWLVAHKKWWGNNDPPQELTAALKSDSFYTQALGSDAAASNFADIPVTKPANASFIVALLQARRQDIGLVVPSELVVSVVRPDRVFVWSVTAQDVKAIPACDEIFNAAQTKYDAMVEKYQSAEKKSDKEFEAASRVQEEADTAMRKCYGARAKDQPFFANVVKQAQELVDKLK